MKILAVSGGVDSMVMMEMLADEDSVVVHVDHGIRENSWQDYEFVEKKAWELGLEFRGCHLNLGPEASEETARKARYDFLYQVREEMWDKYPWEDVLIYTAHHLDDLLESIAINCLRGTGWRGLIPLGNEEIQRPFLELGWGKKEILEFADDNFVEFRQDPTNTEDKYLRNRVREKLREMPAETREKVLELWREQQEMGLMIEAFTIELVPGMNTEWKRSWFRGLDERIALEMLRLGLRQMEVSATRPQIENFRQAILNYAPGKSFNLPGGKLIRLEKDSFYLR